MHDALFVSRRKRAMAALLSPLALLVMLVYLLAPVSPDASLAASRQASDTSMITGEVRTPGGKPVRGARVRLVFRDAEGNLIRKLTVRVRRDGSFTVRMPEGASWARVKVFERPSESARVVSRLFRVEENETIEVTATFPERRGGLLPGVFPY